MKTLVIGAAIIDLTLQVDNLPVRGSDVLSKNKNINIGGCAYNVANILQHFKVDYDLFIPIGEGFNASIIEKDLQINNHKIIIKDHTEDNGFCIALVEPDGERTFVTSLGIESKIKESWFDLIDISNYQNIYFEGYRMMNQDSEILLNKLETINNQKTKIFFCPGPMFNKIDSKLIERIMKLKPILHLNEQEIKTFINTNDLQEAVQKLYQLNQNDIFITIGPKGVIHFDGQKLVTYEQNQEQKAIDSSGAGDAHIATIIASISQSKTIKEACQLANLIAAQVVKIQGTRLKDNSFINSIGEE